MKDTLDSTITILTSDGFEIKITEEMANFSNIWKEMLNIEDEILEEQIKLPTSIRKELLDDVIDFINKSINDGAVGEIPKPLPIVDSFQSITGIPSWAEEWLQKKSKLELQTTIMCANFLDIQTLLHLCSAYIAYQIKGKTPDEIKLEWDHIPVNPKLN